MGKSMLETLAARYENLRPTEDLDAADGDSYTPYQVWHAMVVNTADVLAMGNPRFDRQRFYKACGLGG